MRTSLAIGVSVLSLVSGCSLFMRSIERPAAEVRDVTVSSAGFTGVAGELSLEVSNPNSFGVPLSAIDWELAIGNTRAVTGSVQLSQTIPAKGVAPVTTSLTIQAQDAIAVASQLAGGARDYQIHARLTFSTKVGPLAIDVHHQGQLGSGGGLVDQASRLLGAN